MLQVASSILSVTNVFLLLTGICSFTNIALPGFSRSLKICVSVIITLSLISFLYYLMLVLNIDFAVFWIALTIINIAHLKYSYQIIKKIKAYPFSNIYNLNSVVLGIGILLCSIFFLFHGSKYGDGDAWGFWNTHAKFLYDNHHWNRLFADNEPMLHTDYPLMLPSLIAFFWKITNSTSFIIPLLFSFFTAVGVVLFLYYSLRFKNENYFAAWLGFILIISDTNFQLFSSAQSADILLSAFILILIVLNNNSKHTSGSAGYILGFIGASCMWVKNEGILFFVIFSVVFLLKNYKRFDYLYKYAIGSIIPILVIISFKFIYAPSNDLMAANHNQSQALHNLFNVNRYIVIFNQFFKLLVNDFWYISIILFLTLLLNRKALINSSFLIIILLLAGYFFVYLNTPYDLQWHLSTSLNRLLYHIYPSFIYLTFISINHSSKNTLALNIKV